MTVDGLAPSNRLASIGARWNHGLGASIANTLSQRLCIVGFVGHPAPRGHTVEQGMSLRHVVNLAGAEP